MYNQQLKRKQELEKRIDELSKKIDKLPEGKLLCCKNGSRTKYYLSSGYHPVYIKKKDISFAERLAVKRYYELEREKLEIEKASIELYINKYQIYENKNASVLDADSPHNELIRKYLKQEFSLTEAEWLAQPFNKSKEYPEKLIHKTLNKEKVRSKSELIIANTLFYYKIPYRYECELIIDGKIFYPDFTILSPKDQKIYYWEHFGLMDSKDYINKTCNKLRIYAENDIIPTVNLLATFEKGNNPVDAQKVYKLIEEYFL